MMFTKKFNTHRICKWWGKALIRLQVCADWSEALLVAHTTLLEISCCGSFVILTSSSLSFLFFPDYLEVVTAVVVPRGVGKLLPYIDIVLIFFHILVLQNIGFWRKAEYRSSRCKGRENYFTYHWFSWTDSIKTSLLFSCRFSLFLKDPFFPDYLD